MSDTPLSTRPLNSSEMALRNKFAENIAGQSELMDKLVQQLIALELAIPGLYATVLKLTQGEAATLSPSLWLYAAFGCWSLALIVTLVSLVPRQWRVDPTVLRQDPAQPSNELGLEQFFFVSARYKRRLLIPAIVLFWLGIVCAALVIF